MIRRPAATRTQSAVFADAERVEPDLIRQRGLVHHVAQDLRMRALRAVASEGHVAERVETDLEGVRHRDRVYRLPATTWASGVERNAIPEDPPLRRGRRASDRRPAGACGQ